MISQGSCYGFADSFTHSLMLDLNSRVTFSFQNHPREKSLLVDLLISSLAERKQALLLVLVHSSYNQFLQLIWEFIQSDIEHILFSMLLIDGPTGHAKRCVGAKIGFSHKQSWELSEGVQELKS